VSASMSRLCANGNKILLEAVMGMPRDLPDWDREVLQANDDVTRM
jgi:hypothetical protein